MLRQEAARLEGPAFDPGQGLCTCRLTKQKLALAAADAERPAGASMSPEPVVEGLGGCSVGRLGLPGVWESPRGGTSGRDVGMTSVTPGRTVVCGDSARRAEPADLGV